MERLNIGELNRDTIISAIEKCRKTTLELTRIANMDIIDEDVRVEWDFVFGGLWELLFALYPLEALEDVKRAEIYNEFQEYLENDTKSLDDVLKMIEETEIK